MKKWLISFTALATLTACSVSNQEKQSANDSYQKNASTPTFAKLETAGVFILGQSDLYQLPNTPPTKIEKVDIRPPSTALALIPYSVAQFNGKVASIIYPAAKRSIYNLNQIKLLLTEQNIKYATLGKKIKTDWIPARRNDDIGDIQVRYLIQELNSRESNALTVEILKIKRDDISFTPNIKDKERYTSDLLNLFISKLQSIYERVAN